MIQYLLSAGLAILLSACSATGSSGGPPDIVYGRHICLECGMIISEERVAAAYEWEGEDRVFDDIGDMLIHGKDAGEPGASTPAWVHDYGTAAWIAAATAWFVSGEGIVTPMGRGIIAFASRTAAEEFASRAGG